MKKSIFAFAAALAALVACNKNDVAPMQPQNQESLVPCELTVGICGAMTKATAVSADNEAKVNNLQVFVFRGDDLDAYASVDNAHELTLSCTAGDRVVYALVNAPDYSAVPGKAALLAKVSELSANSLTNFEMVGSKIGFRRISTPCFVPYPSKCLLHTPNSLSDTSLALLTTPSLPA